MYHLPPTAWNYHLIPTFPISSHNEHVCFPEEEKGQLARHCMMLETPNQAGDLPLVTNCFSFQSAAVDQVDG